MKKPKRINPFMKFHGYMDYTRRRAKDYFETTGNTGTLKIEDREYEKKFLEYKSILKNPTSSRLEKTRASIDMIVINRHLTAREILKETPALTLFVKYDNSTEGLYTHLLDTYNLKYKKLIGTNLFLVDVEKGGNGTWHDIDDAISLCIELSSSRTASSVVCLHTKKLADPEYFTGFPDSL